MLPRLALSADSLYSDLSDKACKVVHRSEENYGVEQECPGVLGYKLQKTTEDDRDSLTIIEGHRSQPLNFYGHITGSLNYLGDKAEWRITDGKPIALIVRMTFTNPESQKKEQRLIVAKVASSGSCVTQVINASTLAIANEQAEKAADHAFAEKCLWMIEPKTLEGYYAFDRLHLPDSRCALVTKEMALRLSKEAVCETDTSGPGIAASCRSMDGQKEHLLFKQASDCERQIANQRQ